MDQDLHSDEKIIDVLSLRTVAVIGMSKHSSKQLIMFQNI